MSKVDNRIVEMGFENKSFEKGIKDSQASLKDFDKSLTNIASNSSPLSSLGGIVNGIGGKFSLLGTIGVGALLNIGAQAVTAGQQLVKSMGIDQITAGFSEYELKINSIKVMLAGGMTKEGLPVTLDMVNSELEKLNAYSDQTIYSFSDMTRNIGKFTNAGVDLESAVQAIKGIANAAALSGANSEEAARAMYNFAQALSAGYVKLIDWKSIENANMATVDFKTQLMESAVAAGTLEKTADGMYRVLTGGGMDELIAPTKRFNESLEKQWMTSEVLTTTLTKYADATTDIGAKATEAATKVRTFHQLMDTTKEALGSGWAMTFEHLFGDYDEATKMWTAVSDTVGGLIQRSNDARNDLLKTWKAFGGRIKILDGLSSAWKSLSLIFGLVKETFKNVFPPITITTLMGLSIGFEKLMKSLKPSLATLSSLKKIFKGVFSAVFLAWKLLTSVFTGLVNGIKAVMSIIPTGKNGGILGFLAKIATFFSELSASAKKADIFIKISATISNAILAIGMGIKKFYKIISESALTQLILDKLSIAINWLKESFLNFTPILKESSSSISEAMKNLGRSFNKANESGDKLAKFFSRLGEIFAPIGKFFISTFNKIKDTVSEKWKIEGFSGLLDVINTILHGGVLVMLVDLVRTLSTAFGSAGSISGNITGIFGLLQTTLKSYQDTLKAKTLLLIASAIAILVVSVGALSLIDPQKLSDAVFALGILFAELTTSMMVLEKGSKNGKMFNTIAIQLMGLAIAILLISSALTKIASIPADRLMNGIKGLSIVLSEIIVFSKLMGNSKSFIGAATGLVAIGIALNIIVLSIKALGNIDPTKLKQGLLALGEIAAGLTIFAISISQASKGANLLAIGVALGLIAIVILELVGAVALLGSIKPDALANGLIGLGVILSEILAFSIFMSQAINPGKLLASAISMEMMAIAILEIVGAVALMGGMAPKSLGQGLLGLGATLVILAGGLAILSNPSFLIGAGIMVIMAGAIMLLTPSLLALGAVPIENIGKALLSLAGIFIIVGLAGYLLMPVVPAILAVSVAIAIFGAGILAIGAGMVLFGAGLTALSVGGVAAIGLLVIAIKEIILLIPAILVSLAKGIIEFAKVITLGAPIIAGAIGAVILSLIAVLGEEIPKLVIVLLDLISLLLKLLVKKVPEFIDAGMKIIIGFINGITANVGGLIKAGADLIIAFLDGMGTEIPRVIDAAFTMIIDFINGLADSIRENTPLLLEAAANLATAFIDGLKDYFNIEEGESIVGSLIDGLVKGAKAGVNLVVKAVEDLGTAVLDGIKKLLGIASPSKEMKKIGEYIDMGLIQGLKAKARNVADTAKEIGENSITALRSTMDRISDVVDSEINSSPVITPVLNLNNLRSNANTLNQLLSKGQSYNLATGKIRDDKLSLIANQNGSNLSPEKTQIVNEFNLNGVTIRSDADITKLAEELYRRQENAMRSRGIRPAYSS